MIKYYMEYREKNYECIIYLDAKSDGGAVKAAKLISKQENIDKYKITKKNI